MEIDKFNFNQLFEIKSKGVDLKEKLTEEKKLLDKIHLKFLQYFKGNNLKNLHIKNKLSLNDRSSLNETISFSNNFSSRCILKDSKNFKLNDKKCVNDSILFSNNISSNSKCNFKEKKSIKSAERYPNNTKKKVNFFFEDSPKITEFNIKSPQKEKKKEKEIVITEYFIPFIFIIQKKKKYFRFSTK